MTEAKFTKYTAIVVTGFLVTWLVLGMVIHDSRTNHNDNEEIARGIIQLIDLHTETFEALGQLL
ncbi:MAG: hypothetical protein ACE5H1_01995 [Thermodesulfobacteriota bacterium]